MILDVKDPVGVAVAATTAAGVDGVARVFAPAWRAGARTRGRGQGVTVTRSGDGVAVSLRVVLERDARVLDVVRTVQRSVAGELRRLTGLTAEVGVTVVDLD